MRTNYNIPSAKRGPQRTCVACRTVRAKQELVRIVRTPENTIELDVSGKKAGRGAYLCKVPECWKLVLDGNNLERTLKTKFTQEEREKLARLGNEIFRTKKE
jgi:uncharacterized protein